MDAVALVALINEQIERLESRERSLVRAIHDKTVVFADSARQLAGLENGHDIMDELLSPDTFQTIARGQAMLAQLYRDMDQLVTLRDTAMQVMQVAG